MHHSSCNCLVGGVDICFFFFQAEDGIRDWSVTGVQTCALPISNSSSSKRAFATPPERWWPCRGRHCWCAPRALHMPRAVDLAALAPGALVAQFSDRKSVV